MGAQSTLGFGNVGSSRKKLESQEPARDGTLMSLCVTSHYLPPFLVLYLSSVSDALLAIKKHYTAGKTYNLKGHTLNNTLAF